jgi:hypothetical protein
MKLIKIMPKPKIGEMWRHYKRPGDYEILNFATLQVEVENLDIAECVIYKSLETNKIWVRPVADFIGKVLDKNGEVLAESRFIFIK